MHLEKNWTYACTFPVQRKEIKVVKVRFTMRYSSRKLSNVKWQGYNHSLQLLKTNCLFFPGYEWKHFIFRQKIFEISPFFLDLGKKKNSRMLITFFRPELATHPPQRSYSISFLTSDLTLLTPWRCHAQERRALQGWRMTRFLQSLSRVRQTQTSERNALLAGCFSRWRIHNNSQHRGSGNLLAVR